MENDAKNEKLDSLLSKVQKEIAREPFIYGVTNRAGRGLATRANDFLVDHSRVPLKKKAYFFELLATMLHAGIPLNRSLKILISKTEHPRLARIVATLSYELEHGRPLSSALDRFADVFDETERGAIRSAEAVGNLEHMLVKIAEQLNRRADFGQRLMGALLYPSIVLSILTIAAVAMLVFVVPKIQEVFAENTLTLPAVTRAILAISGFLKNSWWMLLILLLFVIVGFHMYTHSENGRFAWDFRKLRIPFVGTILRKIYVLRFMDTMGILLESGLPINKALEFTAGALGNEVYRLKTFEALGAVQEGKKLSSSLATAPFLFPEMVTNMVAVGEHSASLGDLSRKISFHFEREIDHTLKSATTIMGPVLILFIGVTFAVLALAVMLPIFSLTQSIQ